MKRILAPSLLAVPILSGVAFASPAAILTRVSGDVSVMRGTRKLVAKNGLGLELGDKVTVKGGSASVFSLGRPPQTLTNGSLTVGSGVLKTATPGLWKTVYNGLHRGLNHDDERIAATMRPGEITPVSPLPGLITTAHPTFEWLPMPGVKRYRVTIKKGSTELLQADLSGTKLPWTSPALLGAWSWQVSPLHLVDGKWQPDAGASAPLTVQAGTPLQLIQIQGELGALDDQLKTAAPAERHLARAAVWEATGFHEAALAELASAPEDSTVRDLQRSIWLETGQGWRLNQVTAAKVGPNSHRLALELKGAFQVQRRKTYSAPDGSFSLQIPQRFCEQSFATPGGANFSSFTDFSALGPGGAHLKLIHGAAANFRGTDALLAHAKPLLIEGKTAPEDSVTFASGVAAVFLGHPARLTRWNAVTGGVGATGGALEWRVGREAYLAVWSAGGAQEADAIRPLFDTLKFGASSSSSTLPSSLLKTQFQTETAGARQELTLIATRRAADKLPAVVTTDSLDNLDRALQNTPENSHARSLAAHQAAAAAANQAWIALDQEDGLKASAQLQKRADLDRESYGARRAANLTDLRRGDKQAAHWLSLTPPLSLARQYADLIEALMNVKAARLEHLLEISQLAGDSTTVDDATRQLFDLHRAELEDQRLSSEGQDKVWAREAAIAGVLERLGDVSQARADLDGARAYLSRAEDVRRALPASFNQRNVPSALQKRAKLESALGETELARDFYQQTLTEMDAVAPGPQPGGLRSDGFSDLERTQWISTKATVLSDLGVTVQQMGDFAAAETDLQQSLTLLATLPEGAARAELRAGVLSNLAELHADEGDLNIAAECLGQAIEIYRGTGNDGGVAGALVQGAGLDCQRRDLAGASAKLKIARQLFTQLKRPADLVKTNVFASQIESEQGHFSVAASLAQSALTMSSTLDCPLCVAQSACGMGFAKLGMAPEGPLNPETKTQIATLIRTAQKADDCLGETVSNIETLRLRARFAAKCGDLNGALALQTEAIARLERVRATTKSHEAFAEQQVNYRLYSEAVALLLKLNRPEEAFDMLSRARSKKLRDALTVSERTSRDPILQALLTRAATLDDKLAKTKTQLALETARPTQNPVRLKNLRDLIASTQQEFFDISGQIQAKNPHFATEVSLSPVELKKAQRAIPRGTLLLEYAALEDGVYIFAVTRDSLQIYQPKVSRVDLDAAVRAYRAVIDSDVDHLQKAEPVSNIDDPKSNIRALSEQLSSWLLQPVQTQIDLASTVAIVPSGSLFYLPFHALGETGLDGSWKFLIERKPVAYLTAGDVLSVVQDRDLDNQAAGVLALGDPTGANLPDARLEVEGIAKLFPDSQALTGAGATKDSLLVPGSLDKRVLHLAAHGVLDSANPRQSFIQLSPSARDDGKLRAGEIVGMDLNRVDLVTLSACRTALGEGSPDGSEISSLAQSFSSAGTPSVMASLWNVEDSSTARLMNVFYGALAQETPKGMALQRAQIALLSDPKTRQPVYWAPFELMGDWR